MPYNSKKILRNTLIALFFLFILTFGFLRSYNLIFGVKIKNVNIVDGTQYQDATLDITGNAKNAKMLTLNGREISISREGDFYETIALLPGYNIITIEAQDKFGNIDKKDYKLIY